MTDQKQKRRRLGFGCCTAGRAAGMVMVAAGWLDDWCMVTVAHALVHRIRGTASNLLFRLYVGQEWLSPATLSMGGAWEEEEVDWHYIAALSSIESPHFLRLSNCRPPLFVSASFDIKSFMCWKKSQLTCKGESDLYGQEEKSERKTNAFRSYVRVAIDWKLWNAQKHLFGTFHMLRG